MRFFAAARAAVGRSEAEVDASTLGDALSEVTAGLAGSKLDRWEDLRSRCSYLVDGVTTRDLATSLEGVAAVDVMPPFAGG
ncbi:MoaD/ThiS family protein [Frondihabitans australicus]|uniref:Molybdopterin converting factor small subunit n=1 Tax=Frondihabitans australicus TaxID=386892 RepID=A0A495IBD4_9MICO|nr:MoaD/ThiS family protein [Frondihabitans australicus]RKR73313.1 molybdopterin converting factor small subunit [Frondihabitans australicus]